MSWEVLKDARGSTTDSEGRPYNESFTQQEGRRLEFEKWRLSQQENQTTPQEPIPQKPITVVETGNVTSVGEFFERHRRRGPYRKGNPYQPGI